MSLKLLFWVTALDYGLCQVSNITLLSGYMRRILWLKVRSAELACRMFFVQVSFSVLVNPLINLSRSYLGWGGSNSAPQKTVKAYYYYCYHLFSLKGVLFASPRCPPLSQWRVHAFVTSLGPWNSQALFTMKWVPSLPEVVGASVELFLAFNKKRGEILKMAWECLNLKWI